MDAKTAEPINESRALPKIIQMDFQLQLVRANPFGKTRVRVSLRTILSARKSLN